MPSRHALTDEQWDRIKDCLPGKPGDPGRSASDTAYDGEETRNQIRKLKAAACIKPHANRTSGKRFHKIRYRNRNQV